MKPRAGEDRRRSSASGGALSRGLMIIDALIVAPTSMSLSAIAELVSLDITTTSRLLRTLEEASYVQRDRQTRAYSPTPKAIQPLPVLHPVNVMRQESQPIIAKLSRKLHETTLLMLFFQGERMIISVTQYPGSLLPLDESWPRTPLHATASGQILLQSLTEQERIDKLGKGPFEAATETTITELSALNAQLEINANRGYALLIGTAKRGMTSVGVPVQAWNGQIVGCLVTTGLTELYTEDRIQTIISELKIQSTLLPITATSIQKMVHYLPGIRSLGTSDFK